MSQPINQPNNEQNTEETNEVIEFVPLLNFEADYEILNQYPFTIRRKDNHRILGLYDRSKGYPGVLINGKAYFMHRLVALQFIPNPDNLPIVDHISHDISDYHLSNLRWCSSSTNNRNRRLWKGIVHEFTDNLPNDAFEIEYYETRNSRRYFKDYYYSITEDKFYYDNEVNYRILPSHLTNSGSEVVCLRDIENKTVSVVIYRFKQQQGI